MSDRVQITPQFISNFNFKATKRFYLRHCACFCLLNDYPPTEKFMFKVQNRNSRLIC